MQGQGGNPNGSDRPQTDPECLFQILEQQDPYNPREMCFFIKIVVTKEMRSRMIDIEKNKREKMVRIEQKEKTPEMVALKEKCETFRRLDAKSMEEERRKNAGQNEMQKSLAEYEHFQLLRQKYTFNLFDTFIQRGKSNNIKFSYNQGDKFLGIRINKNYFLHEMHFSRRDLFNVAITFTRTWEFDFHGMIRVLWRIYTQSEKPIHYNLFIRALDLISVTFDVVYHDKRIYRFRYSPFQFRTSPIFKEDNQLTGYNQTLSCIPQLSSSSKAVISDQEFYSSPRFFIFDDLTDSNLFIKLLNRTNLIYQIYTICRGGYSPTQGSTNPQLDIDEFAKKSLGHFYFSSTRLKKFMFTWSFREYRRPQRDRKPKEEEKVRADPKEVILHIPFQLDRDNNSSAASVEPVYRMRMQILQTNKVITYAVKDQIAFRVRQWYLLIKEMLLQREKAFFESEKLNLSRPRNQRDPFRMEVQDFEMYVQFSSRDRFDKFFIGFLLLVSTVLDRHYFTLQDDKERKREESKLVSLETQETSYSSSKRQYMVHNHCVRLTFRHTYFPNMFFTSAREEEKQSFYNYLQNSRNCEYRLRCGEWRLQRVLKIKRKANIKSKEEAPQVEEAELTSFPEEFKKYIGILVRHFPLRVIYKDILSFVEAVSNTCYMPQEENNVVNLNGYDNVLRSIVNVLMQQYYYCQFKEKEDRIKEAQKEKQKEKEKEREKEREREKEDKTNINQIVIKEEPKQKDPEAIKKERDRLQDLFSRVLIIKIITRGDVGFAAQEKLLFEVTFKLMEFKTIWQTRIKEGSLVLRIFDDRLEFERDYVTVHVLKGDVRNKKLSDEANIRANLEACFLDPKSTTAL